MSEDVYYKLGERLNQGPMKMPLVEPFLNLLREYYTEEQAVLGAAFPVGAHKARDLAKQLNRDEKELADLLESMADGGLVFALKDDGGAYEYTLLQFIPGVVEFQLMKGTDTPKDRKIARMFDELMKNMGKLMNAAKKDAKPVKDKTPKPVKDETLKPVKDRKPKPPIRTVTVEKELPAGSEIYPYEKLTELIEKESSFAAAKCYCRHHDFLVDKPCKAEGVPEYSCLAVGRMADYVAERKFGKRITREECLNIVEAAEEAGLVHNVGNALDQTSVICNCCGCCCGILKILRKVGNMAMLVYSNFEVAIDKESCSGCQDCLARCQMQAMSMNGGEVVTVNNDRCIGCGNCVTACPTECLSMVRRKHDKPPVVGKKIVGFGV